MPCRNVTQAEYAPSLMILYDGLSASVSSPFKGKIYVYWIFTCSTLKGTYRSHISTDSNTYTVPTTTERMLLITEVNTQYNEFIEELMFERPINTAPVTRRGSTRGLDI